MWDGDAVDILGVDGDRAWIRDDNGMYSSPGISYLTPPPPAVAWVANVYPGGVLGRRSSRDAADLYATTLRTHVLTYYTDGTAKLEAVDANN
jgi:hypothetical protein